MSRFYDKLQGGDLRSIGNANQVVSEIKDQQDFNELFKELYSPDRKVAMRAADAIEKITGSNSSYLHEHKKAIFTLCDKAGNIEAKWHLALLLSRIAKTKKDVGKAWNILTNWATDHNQSRIVRVNSIQGLWVLLENNQELKPDFNGTLLLMEQENIPSINARIRKIRKGKTLR